MALRRAPSIGQIDNNMQEQLDKRQAVAVRTCGDCFRAIPGQYAKWCDDCRWRHRGKKAKYVWTPARDAILRQRYDSTTHGRADEIARLLGFPTWVVRKRAGQLALAAPSPWIGKRVWSTDEDAFLLQHAGVRTTGWIGRRLRRSETAVCVRVKRLRISRKLDEGYTARQVAEGFGLDSHVVERWIGRRWISAKRATRGNGGPHATWSIQPDAVREFIKRHPMDFDIRKVDQVWFLDVLGVITGEVAP